MDSACTDKHLIAPATMAGVAFGYASRGPVLLAGSMPTTRRRQH